MIASTQVEDRVRPLSVVEAKEHAAASCCRTVPVGAVGLEHWHRTGDFWNSTDDEESAA